MKTINYYWSIFAFVALLFTSCTTEETAVDTSPDAKNSAELTFGALLDNLANRSMNKDHFSQVPTCSDAEPDMAMVTFSYPGSGGDKVVEVGISEDSDGYFTEYNELLKIPVAQGTEFTKVTLKGFRVYDSSDNLIWVAPIAPGDFAGYITKPLPFDVDVYAGTKPYIDVEVLCFDRRDVNEYGYPFFDLVPGKIYPLCFFANLCVGERHFVGDYTLDLYYDDGTGRIQLYTSGDANAMPTTGLANGNYFANPLCVVVPDKPEGFLDSQDYLFYVITPKDWTGNYGDVNNTPLAEEGLSWNDVNALLNTDGETNEYIHVFIGCDDTPGGGDDCASNGGDIDGDGVCDDIDDCINGVGDGCPGGGDDCTDNGGDLDGDGVCDDIDDCINGVGDGCDNGNGDDCDETVFVGSATDVNAIQFNELQNGPTRWGFIYNFIATGDVTTKTLDIYAGASTQYNLNSNTDIGDVTITYNQLTDEITVTFDFENANNDLGTLHVNISETVPGEGTLQAPGSYNNNRDVEVNDGDSFTFDWDGDDDFYIVIHGDEACKDGGND
ncbi:hypothetical protein [Gillisia sp. JM1]|uniref:hypothetical protein n=1 Tax=Gillisia sp. JM1 TaxID=1283286 RepID=UPI000479022A|nr:hypothetical protein [Gillisia sp. JM1]